jgi:hypothetical protein
MQQNPSGETHWSSASQGIPLHVMDLEKSKPLSHNAATSFYLASDKLIPDPITLFV